MGITTIYSSNTQALLNGTELVYSGKSGYISDIGVIDCLCVSQEVSFNTLTLAVANLHLIHDSILLESLTNYSNTFIRVPISQSLEGVDKIGSTGYISNEYYTSLEVVSSNASANTITVRDAFSYDNVKVSSLIPSTPYRIRLFQPTISNNTVFVSGTKKPYSKKYDVSTTIGQYVATLRVMPRIKSDIRVFLDDIEITNFTWPYETQDKLQVPISSGDAELLITVVSDTVPAFESNDSVTLSTYSNTYSIRSTNYYSGDQDYSEDMNINRFYSVRLDSSIPWPATSSKLINTSTDLLGTVSNLSSNSFNLSYSDSYPFTYNLANNKIYYLYPKNKVTLVNGRLDEYGRLLDVPVGTYLVTATNVNNYNRSSPSISDIINIEPLRLSKVENVDVTESIIIDTTSGAAINATVSFPPIEGRDVQSYEVKYRVLSADSAVSPEFSSLLISQNTSAETLRATITNLARGRYVGSNTLELRITPLNASYRGFITSFLHPLIGKTEKPSGLKNLTLGQQDLNLLFSWQFQQTTDGYIKDLDTKEVEIREYKGSIDTSNPATVSATWSLALPVARISFPSTTYSMPVSKFGEFTYLLRVRDTSNIESDEIAAFTTELYRPSNIKVYKAYNEKNPEINYVVQDGLILNNANVDPEASFTSFSEGINGGLVYYNSSNTDNSNGSATGFSVFSNTDYLTTGSSSISTYITPIRDLGFVVPGTLRIEPTISISNPGFTYDNQYEVVFSGISDYHPSTGLPVSSNVLVDNAFGGIGHILGFNNAQAATVTYNTFHRTLTSGGAFGNVYAIASTGSGPNAYVIAKIAGVIDANSIAIGEVYFSNGFNSGSNAFPNVAIAGNSYELINLYQFADSRGSFTFLGPESSIVQNIFVRASNSNVFYEASANGISGYPGHGNTNPNAFYGAATNASLGWKSYVPGQQNFRYFQIKLEYINKAPNTTEILLEDFKYQVDVRERTYLNDIHINNEAGVLVDYSFMNYLEIPKITATSTGSAATLIVISEKSTSNCLVVAYDSQNGNPSNNAYASISVVGI